MKTTYTCSDSRCPTCGKAATAASDPMSDATPSPHDFSICAYCSSVLRFNDDMTMREAVAADLDELEPDTLLKLRRLQRVAEALQRLGLGLP